MLGIRRRQFIALLASAAAWSLNDGATLMNNCKVALASFVGIAAIMPTAAQAQGITRQLMQTTDFPAGYTTVTGIATIAAGSCAGPHIHPGLETSYMLEGEIILKIDGKPDQKFKAGDSLQVPIAAKHDACNPGGLPAKVLTVYVIEKGKPAASPAP
jgi:quercetin dioxygenase-like cupin family protein